MEKSELTKAEVYIMKAIWSSKEQLRLAQIVDIVNENYHTNWMSQTVSTYLGRLVKKGFIRKVRVEKTWYYEVLKTEDEYMSREMARFTNLWGDQSVTSFVAALNRQQPISKQEKMKMRELLDELDELD